MKIYSISSMIVKTVLMDMEFNRTIYDLTEKPVVNNYPTKEQVA